ncbi:hypothetical protein [Pseudooceanicola nitratireducens]|uniref:hypothetical protein n=1 Tax=Pseudooceanicola nitratireducens TaxID=517719 RepID=UPI001C98CBB5|nr:hypothetical protein [Pseudooceanicola nitratireducens]MBY6156869.1 hypothetical protein [Pseudooceanicola nitratireducens]
MDFLEKATFEYLKVAFPGCIPGFEPCGPSKFPDFLVSGEVLVECTRLTFPEDDRGNSPDTTEPRIRDALIKALEGLKFQGQRQFLADVTIDNLPDPQELKKPLRLFSRKILEEGIVEGREYEIIRGMYVSFSDFEFDGPGRIQVASHSNYSGTGWVLADLKACLNATIDRKNRKLSEVDCVYSSAWLAVGSILTCATSQADLRAVAAEFSGECAFDKVLFVDYLHPQKSCLADLGR